MSNNPNNNPTNIDRIPRIPTYDDLNRPMTVLDLLKLVQDSKLTDKLYIIVPPRIPEGNGPFRAAVVGLLKDREGNVILTCGDAE